ncbi:MAG TPA: hypothetical protein VF710_04865 [Longimicrobium sp.]
MPPVLTRAHHSRVLGGTYAWRRWDESESSAGITHHTERLARIERRASAC